MIQTAAPGGRGAAVRVYHDQRQRQDDGDRPAGTTVDGLLTLLNVKREYTAVAVNRDITPKSTYTAVTLSEGDKVEIVRPMGGG